MKDLTGRHGHTIRRNPPASFAKFWRLKVSFYIITPHIYIERERTYIVLYNDIYININSISTHIK